MDKIYVMKKDSKGKFTDAGYTIDAVIFNAIIQHFWFVAAFSFTAGVLIQYLVSLITG